MEDLIIPLGWLPFARTAIDGLIMGVIERSSTRLSPRRYRKKKGDLAWTLKHLPERMRSFPNFDFNRNDPTFLVLLTPGSSHLNPAFHICPEKGDLGLGYTKPLGKTKAPTLGHDLLPRWEGN